MVFMGCLTEAVAPSIGKTIHTLRIVNSCELGVADMADGGAGDVQNLMLQEEKGYVCVIGGTRREENIIDEVGTEAGGE